MKLQAERLKKLANYKYPALILLLGLLLVLWPGRKQNQEAATPEQPPAETVPAADAEQEYRAQTERELERILSKIDGAGTVCVMLTLKSGKTVQYQSDFDSSVQTEGEKTNTLTSQKTVILSRGSAYNEAAVVKTDYPSFQGALIVSPGGGEPSVRYALVNAVSALLGLGADKITVVKSK